MSERVLRGAPTSPGLAIGRARVLSHPSEDAARDPLPPGEAAAAAEAERASDALRQAAAELERIAAELRDPGRHDDAEIVETGALMAADPMLDSAVSEAVTERGLRAAAAVTEATEQHAAVIASLPDALLAARADDVRSLGRRAARIAAGATTDAVEANGSAFVLSERRGFAFGEPVEEGDDVTTDDHLCIGKRVHQEHVVRIKGNTNVEDRRLHEALLAAIAG